MANRVEAATRHHDEKLQEILKASAKIFAEKGFHRTSVRDISRATDMSLAGLYYYFRTKEELLYLIQERCFVTLLQRWEKAVPPETDVRVLRDSLGLSQSDFAALFGFNVRSLQDWEQGRRKPEIPIRAYLAVIQREPQAVIRALRAV